MNANDAKYQRMKGYSVAEIIVATAIFAVIMVAALLIYDRSNQVFKQSVEAGDLQQNVRIGFEKMVADIRMTGYDFDRDGIPSGDDVYQQPDEQVEYADHAAIVIRGNFDAELNNSTDTESGRERNTASPSTDYEPDGGQFPVVTTGNDEIVAYALKSDKAGAPNNNSIVFYADIRKPRRTYTGGSDEMTITIPGVDLCREADGTYNGCMNPPYTLYRITLKDQDYSSNPSAATDFVWSPIATNVRSLHFTYYSDPSATVLVTPNQGTGRFMVSAATPQAAEDARNARETIQAVNIDLVGMNVAASANYADRIEMSRPASGFSPELGQRVADAAQYRQFRLRTTVVPRNIGRRGMEEYATTPPGRPVVTGAYSGCCGIIKVTWTPPPEGIVDGYSIIYDTDPNGPFGSIPVGAGANLFGFVTDLDPATTYYFKVVASNSFGSNRSNNTSAGIRPINRTRAEAPDTLDASPTAGGNAITVKWAMPQDNVPYNGNNPTYSDGTALPSMPLPDEEIYRYVVHRSLTAGFVPDVANRIWNGLPTAPGAPTYDSGTGLVTFNDTVPKLNCTPYYYRIFAVERCVDADSNNNPAEVALSISEVSAEFRGQSTAAAVPATPVNLSVVPGSTCSTVPNCTITLRWDEVIADTSPTPAAIQINDYQVRRVTIKDGVEVGGTERFFDAPDDTVGNGSVTLAENTAPPPVSENIAYKYSVRAEQCNSESVSAYSAEKIFPCIQMSVTPPSPLIDGEGTASSPWMISVPTSDIVINTTQTITGATARLHRADGTFVQNVSPTGLTATSATFSVPLSGNDGTTYYLDMTVTDPNCSDTRRVYMTDAPSSCCLAPWKINATTTFDSSIVVQGATNRFVKFKLRNMCDDDLRFKGFRVTVPAGGGTATQIEEITFPTASGTATDTTIRTGTVSGANVTIEVLTTGATPPPLPATLDPTITAGSSTYEITIKFSKNISPSNVVDFCPIYDRNTEVDVRCKIAPTPGTCN